MSKPIVAIVGRPNVGKSTLVNRIAQKKEAIVHESRGVTRDRSYHDADWNGVDFTLVDTGGIETGRSDDAFSGRIREQAEAACVEADVIVFVVDATTGVTDEDETVARILRRAGKPVFLVANKLDNPSDEKTLWDFYSLGLGEPRPISAVHGHGTGDLLDEVVAALPEQAEEPEYPEDALRVAIIGRPNVGKSSITNRFAGKNRSIVSDVAGTTRDALDGSWSARASATDSLTPPACESATSCTRTSSTTASSGAFAPSTRRTCACSSWTPPRASPSRTRRSQALRSSAVARSSSCSTSGTSCVPTRSARTS